jgi:hypothetical protein
MISASRAYAQNQQVKAIDSLPGKESPTTDNPAGREGFLDAFDNAKHRTAAADG